MAISTSASSRSLWMETELPSYPSLSSNMNIDVCIIGAGIAGLTCAYTLLRRGKTVAIVDQASSCGGQTMRTTGHLAWTLDDRFYNLEGFFGKKDSRLAAESHMTAIRYIEKIVSEELIDCDFEKLDGYLFIGLGNNEANIDKELAALQRISMPVEKKTHLRVTETFDLGPCLALPEQAQFHIGKYLKGLLRVIRDKGGLIFNQTHVSKIEEYDNLCIVHTDGKHLIKAQAAIVATCTPCNNRFTIHTKQAPYRTYVIGTSVPKDVIPKALYWDNADPYHYIRLQKHAKDPEKEWLLVGGADHKTGQEKHTINKYDYLIAWAKQRFPMINSIEWRWSGQVFEPIDGLAFIGQNPGQKNIYIITGDSGNGLTHGTIAGLLLPDLIDKHDNPWRELYAPNRKTLSASLEYLEENANTAFQYTDWLTAGDRQSLADLKPDSGIIIRKGFKKIAVYKDENDQIHCYSAFCPHLGGCVRWNESEKSWDCPCHGSRFSADGKLITGPGNDNLQAI